MQYILEDRSLREIGLLAEPIFENPIHLFDLQVRSVFAVVNEDRYVLPPDCTPAGDNTRIDDKQIALFKLGDFYKYLGRSRGPLIYPKEGYSYRSLYINVFYSEGAFAGQIFIAEVGREILDKDYPLLDVFCVMIESALRSKDILNLDRSKELEEMLVTLLDHKKMLPETQIEAQIREIEWNIHDQYFCMVVRPAPSVSLAKLANQLFPVLPGNGFIAYDEKLVYIFNLTDIRMSQAEFLDSLREKISGLDIKIGVSTTFRDIKYLYHYYRQACIALDLAAGSSDKSRLCHFDQVYLPYILKCAVKELPPRSMWPEYLNRLREYDLENGTEFIRTLQVYLEENMNAAETQRKLFIHRNTFWYRLRRIEELLGVSLSDPDIRLSLLLAFRLCDSSRK